MHGRLIAPTPAPARSPSDRVAALLAAHEEALHRAARRHSMCLDDANDALQRALEIYLRRASTIDPTTELQWMLVVVKNEAKAVRRGRVESVSGEEVDADAQPDEDLRTPEDRIAAAERVERSAEALARLKPDERKALVLKAEGHSYDEIAAANDWTYTNVMATIAVFVAMGGTSYAALQIPRNSVGSAQVRAKAIGGSELRTNAVTSRAVRDRSIAVKDLSTNARSSLRGQTGPVGPQGAPGPEGPAAVQYRATIDQATRVSGNATGLNHDGGSNSWSLEFGNGRSMADCHATASVTGAPAPRAPESGGGTAVVGRSENLLVVRTYGLDGAPKPLPFEVIVAC